MFRLALMLLVFLAIPCPAQDLPDLTTEYVEGSLTVTPSQYDEGFIPIAFKNTSDTRKIDPLPWFNALKSAKVTDEFGNRYKIKQFLIPRDEDSILPGASSGASMKLEKVVPKCRRLIIEFASPSGKKLKWVVRNGPRR
jgi:hypothetical protein